MIKYVSSKFFKGVGIDIPPRAETEGTIKTMDRGAYVSSSLNPESSGLLGERFRDVGGCTLKEMSVEEWGSVL